MNSTLVFAVAVAVALLLYALWGRVDRRKEHVVRQVAADVAALGDVVATSLSPRIDPERCIGSGACVAACPEKDVIGLIAGQAQLVNPLGCIGHGACQSACPVQAITLVYGSKTRGVELPLLDPNFQTNRRGVYIAGELGGMGLIRNAATQGRQAAEHILRGDPERGPRRGSGDVFDVLVVGAGPAGISATLRLMAEGLRVLLVDREGLGGTILHYPRAKLVMTGPLEFPLYGKIDRRTLTKEELLTIWADIGTKYPLPLVTGPLVTGLSPSGDHAWTVHSDRGDWRAANVILALGGRGSPRKLEVSGEELTKVSYRLLEPEPFAGRHVLVVGGGNSAVETAVALSEYGRCASVTISYRRAQFARCRAANRLKIETAIQQGAVQALMNTEVRSILTDQVVMTGPDYPVRPLRNDAVIVQVGGTSPAELLSSLGIQLVTKFGES
jgi:thioredoxin reductase (NADPH)